MATFDVGIGATPFASCAIGGCFSVTAPEPPPSGAATFDVGIGGLPIAIQPLAGGWEVTGPSVFVNLSATLTSTATLAASMRTGNEEAEGEVGMSLRRAKDRIAAIVEATPVTTRERGMARSFAYSKDSSTSDYPAGNRRFFIQSDDFATRGPFTPLARSNRRKDVLRLVLCYRQEREDGLLDEILSADYDAISARLLDDSLWSSSTSTIIEVTLPGDRLLSAQIETPDDGLVTMTIPLYVEHQR